MLLFYSPSLSHGSPIARVIVMVMVMVMGADERRKYLDYGQKASLPNIVKLTNTGISNH